jgi:hypothetical protein
MGLDRGANAFAEHDTGTREQVKASCVAIHVFLRFVFDVPIMHSNEPNVKR